MRIIGRMYLYLRPSVQLPFACVNNSRYLDLPNLESMLAAIGFTKVKEKWKEGGKMAYWLFQKVEPSGLSLENFSKKSVLRQGSRNNFSILIEALNK